MNDNENHEPDAERTYRVEETEKARLRTLGGAGLRRRVTRGRLV
jgi:hypothetical protein